MRGLTIAALLVMAFAAPSIAVAESNQNSAYYCVGEVAAGLKYDETQKQWKGTAFTPDQKFVLRLRLVRTFLKKKENQFDEDETIRVYNVIPTNRGDNFERKCSSIGHMDDYEIFVGKYNIVTCDYGLVDYKFNLELNRFLATYAVGYQFL